MCERVIAVVVALCAALVSSAAGNQVRCVVPEGAELLLRVRVCIDEPRRMCWRAWNTTFAYTRAPDIASQINITLPKEVRTHNRTLFAEAVLQHRSTPIAFSRAPLTFHRQREPAKMFLLDPLFARINPDNKQVQERLAAAAAERAHEHEFVMRWRPALHISLGVETATFPTLADTPPVLRMTVDPRTGTYAPPLFASVLATREDECPAVPAQGKAAPMPLAVQVGRSASRRVLWLAQLTQALEQQRRLGFTAKDIDDVKGVFLDTPPLLLAATVAASVLHLALDLLAVRSDIAFWRARRCDLRGISARTVVFDAAAHAVIVLYLWDRRTTLLVLGPAALRVLVDCWKVARVLKLRRNCNSIKADAKAGAKEDTAVAETEEADRRAARWLRMVLWPVVVAYAGYTLVCVPQRSWTSWALGSLASLVYCLGFVMMTPQLVVNRRLRTVAHLPWRALVYRTLNTFIDDLFAFVIRMPTMHRISCFRDDVVFFVFLYQRWKYPVDPSRSLDEDETSAPAVKETKKRQ